MRNWYKFFLYKSPQLDINLERDQKFSEHEKSMGGYKENKYYENEELFFEKYLDKRQKYYLSFLGENLEKGKKVLSIGSGRCATELYLLKDGFNIVCSDLEIPNCYESSKKIFGNFEYKKFNIFTDNLNLKFDYIINLSMIYAFEKNEIKHFFKKISQHLNVGGILIFEPGACEDNLFSLIYDKIYKERIVL
jgi:2-polyprenyl-3-methyl-5-hydroxy-6-metoxy-1,4-benzoquinol methylase